ncbi:MAG TPA: outer membrane beta-barrel protein [Bryobacteraceae bacterium]|nr:outer membrane beta-barrel protein [Bryobacteraceae bacterium]
MRLSLLLLLGAASAIAQPFQFGVKAGTPLTDFLNTAESGHVNYFSDTNRYIVGLTAELHLPFGLGIEVDGLYRHLNYQSTSTGVDAFSSASTTANAWEFPILGKYRFRMPVVHPFIDAGVAFDSLQGVNQAITSTVVPLVPSHSTTSNPVELHHKTTHGYVVGGGVDIHLLVIHIMPEIRYTRWNAEHFFDPNGLLHSNVNQGEFLLGITF